MENTEELRKRYLKEEEELNNIVSVDEGIITINVAYEYYIELNRCNTYEKILAWVLQLSEKTWMSKRVLEKFILVACRENGLENPRGRV